LSSFENGEFNCHLPQQKKSKMNKHNDDIQFESDESLQYYQYFRNSNIPQCFNEMVLYWSDLNHTVKNKVLSEFDKLSQCRYLSDSVRWHLKVAVASCELLAKQSGISNEQARLKWKERAIQDVQNSYELSIEFNGDDDDDDCKKDDHVAYAFADLADSLAINNLHDTAIHYYNRSLQANNQAEVHSSLGLLYFKLKKYNLAAQSLATAVKKIDTSHQLKKLFSVSVDKQFKDELYYLGVAYMEIGDVEQAIVYLAREVVIHPERMKARKILVTLYFKNGIFDLAIPQLQALWDFDRTKIDTLLQLAVAHHYMKDYNNSFKTYRMVISHDRTSLETLSSSYGCVGILHSELMDPYNASVNFKKAAEIVNSKHVNEMTIEKGSDKHLMQLIENYLSWEMFEEAERLIDGTMYHHPKTIPILSQRLKELDFTPPVVLAIIGKHFARSKQSHKAFEYFEQAEARVTEDEVPVYYEHLAYGCFDNQLIDKGNEVMRRGLKKYPESRELNAQMGWIFVLQALQPDT
jgi:tetratricopeptide (TPR) repeat protein